VTVRACPKVLFLTRHGSLGNAVRRSDAGRRSARGARYWVDAPFALQLGCVAIVGVVLRVGFAVLFGARSGAFDSDWYHGMANQIASGRGYVLPVVLDLEVPTAYFPPLYPAVLSIASAFGGTSFLAHQIASSMVGGVTIVLVGLLGRRLFSPAVGLVAATITAIYPMLWAPDVAVMSESLYVPLVVATLLALAGAASHVGSARWAVVGALVGAAALTRGDGLLLLVFLVVPAGVALVPGNWRTKARCIGTAVFVAALVLAPWAIWNSMRFDTVVVLSTNSSTVIRGANCDTTWSGRKTGFWDFGCLGTDRPELSALAEPDSGAIFQR
jgi:4-amino-4-deoxy-L-arabinose transferase-like glycosyltransferase